jgi:hypothetical protein
MANRPAKVIKENRRLVDAKIRFLYEGGIYGEWVNARDAFNNGFMTSDQDHTVTGIQIDSDTRHDSERLRAADYEN